MLQRTNATKPSTRQTKMGPLELITEHSKKTTRILNLTLELAAMMAQESVPLAVHVGFQVVITKYSVLTMTSMQSFGAVLIFSISFI